MLLSMGLWILLSGQMQSIKTTSCSFVKSCHHLASFHCRMQYWTIIVSQVVAHKNWWCWALLYKSRSEVQCFHLCHPASYATVSWVNGGMDEAVFSPTSLPSTSPPLLSLSLTPSGSSCSSSLKSVKQTHDPRVIWLMLFTSTKWEALGTETYLESVTAARVSVLSNSCQWPLLSHKHQHVSPISSNVCGELGRY